MSHNYTHIIDLAKEVEPPEDGILTRTLFNDDYVKAVIFGFGQGEELSEHTASMPAILYFIQGEATLALGDDTVEAQPRTWVSFQPIPSSALCSAMPRSKAVIASSSVLASAFSNTSPPSSSARTTKP